MKLSDYQKKAMMTARGHEKPDEIFHLVLGLVGESGEIAEKFKKWVRDQDSDISKLDKKDMIKEFGDVLWYLAVLADYLKIDLDDVASLNIKKLADRQKRNVLSGSGDHR